MDRAKLIIGAALALLAAGLVWWLMRPGDMAEGGAADPAAETRSEPPAHIDLSAAQIAGLSLTFAPAAVAELVPVANLPAMIVPAPNARVAVAAQLPGVVTRVLVVEGEEVRAGQALATVASRDMVSLAAELSRAKARLDVARANAARLGQLSKEGIVAPARADEASAQMRQAQVDVAEQARLIGMTHGQAGGGGYTLTAPINGRISAMTIEAGKALDPGAAPFVIDGAGAMQVRAQLPERLIGAVMPGMRVRAGSVAGKVLAVGTAIDSATRSATLTAALDTAGDVRAGQSLSLAVMGPAPAGAVRVPGAAVARVDDGAMLFVRTAKGVKVRRVVLAGGGCGDEACVILSGVHAGEQVAVHGVSELKALTAAQ